MTLVILGGFVVGALAVAAFVRHRRGDRLDHLGEDLFEGLLPSAATGNPEDRLPAPESWELRWSDVSNLTAVDHARRPRGGAVSAPRETAGAAAPFVDEGSPVAAEVSTTEESAP
jgi:hypothetical protein